MASERERALRAIVVESGDEDEEDSKLDAALSEAESTRRLQMAQSHAMEMRRAELGWFGKVFGGQAHAAIVVAFVVVILGFGVSIWLWFLAYRTGRAEFWSSEAHISLAAATSALAYVFGRGTKDSK